MIWNWWKSRRRQSLRAQVVPEEWSRILDRNAHFFRSLNREQRKRLLSNMQVFIAEKNWEGCEGLKITPEMQVSVAAQACLLTLEFDEVLYDHVLTILIYPRDFVRSSRTHLGGGAVIVGEGHRAGEAWHRGPVILSWKDTLDGGRDDEDGRNLVFHEFAHQLDMLTGDANGQPPLPTRAVADYWNEVMDREFQQHRQNCRRGQRTFLDCYGAENRAEFFAVLTESFFEQPRALSARHPDLYDLLRGFYRQDPAIW